MLNRCLAAFVLVAALGLLPMTAGARPAKPPAAHVAATCDDYESQADAQRAADTRDADGDGIYCEGLPCPCSTEAGGGGGQDNEGSNPESCTKPRKVQRMVFSKEKYPNIRKHVRGVDPPRVAADLCAQPPRRGRPPRPAA